MGKTRLYIVQFFGVLVLLCSYYMGNRPDSESVMYFNVHPDTPYVLTTGSTNHSDSRLESESVTDQNKPAHKCNNVKQFSYAFVLLNKISIPRIFHSNDAALVAAVKKGYSFLYFKEINPPPPKVC